MKPGRGCGRWLALLCGTALAAGSSNSPAALEEATSEGFIRENLQEIHATVLRPEKWFYRRIIPAFPYYECSSQAFTGPTEYADGLSIHVLQRADQAADDVAAARIAQTGLTWRVLRGWTRKGMPAEPFTTYGTAD